MPDDRDAGPVSRPMANFIKGRKDRMRVAGVILAGGQGRRLGGADKALLPLAGRPMVYHVLDRFAPQMDAVALSANGDPERFRSFGLPVLNDGLHGGSGPLAGVLAGLRWATGLGATHLATVAVDTPLIPRDLVVRLCRAAGGGAAISRSRNRPHPTVALWPVAAEPLLASTLQSSDLRMMAFAGALDPVFVDFDGDPDPFLNANTADDVLRIEAALAGAPS